jgi:diphosphomevalonate decarboxylase
MSSKITVNCECAPNIALIKYWGKANEDLIIPLNGSISITLDRTVLCSKTSLTLTKLQNDEKAVNISITLNGATQEFADQTDENAKQISSSENDLISRKRFFKMLHKVRRNCSLPNPTAYSITITSVNNFPTACGLASSASGFACLALCLAHAFKYNGETSELARLGSGSACRSCTGGFVKWSSGSGCGQDSSAESVARPLASSTHWPQLNVLALVLEDQRKIVSSTNGMRDSVLTSPSLAARAKLVEETRLAEMEAAIHGKDFAKLAELTMKDSNSFHAVCMDTYPPLFYLNDKSKEIVQFVNEFNSKSGGSLNDDNQPRVAYSFDAGPNAFLFTLDDTLVELIYSIFKVYFADQLTEEEFLVKHIVTGEVNKPTLGFETISVDRRLKLDELCASLKLRFKVQTKSAEVIKYLILSKVGREPLVSVKF